MGNTTGGQSVRQQAREAALAAQARRRARQAERDKRLDAAALRLVVALRERDALDQEAARAVQAMLVEGLAPAEIAGWCDGETTLTEVTRLSKLTLPDAP